MEREKKLKILFHTHFYAPENGPAEKRVKGLASNLLKKGHKVGVITGFPSYPTGIKSDEYKNKMYMKEEIDGIKIYRYYTYASPKRTTLNRLLNYFSFLISSIFFIFNKDKYDVIITTSPPLFIALAAYIISRIKKMLLIFDVRDIWPDIAIEMGFLEKKSLYSKVLENIAQFMYKKSDLIFVVSQFKEKSLEKKGINQSKLKYISNGFDKEFLEIQIKKNLIQKYDLKNKKTIIYTGIIGLAQGLDVIIRLAEKCMEEKIQFLMIGDGVEKERLESEVKGKKIENIEFLGLQPHENIRTFLEYAHMSIIPLLNKNLKDSVPTKLFEALGVGCPVFLISEGESREILKKSKGGIGVSPDNFEQIKEKFNMMLEKEKNFFCEINYTRGYVLKNYSRDMITQKLEEEVKILVQTKKSN